MGREGRRTPIPNKYGKHLNFFSSFFSHALYSADIDSASAVPEDFPALEAKYGDVSKLHQDSRSKVLYQGSALSVTNNGHSWKVPLPGEGSSLRGGALPGEFKVDFLQARLLKRTFERRLWRCF